MGALKGEDRRNDGRMRECLDLICAIILGTAGLMLTVSIAGLSHKLSAHMYVMDFCSPVWICLVVFSQVYFYVSAALCVFSQCYIRYCINRDADSGYC